MESLLAGTISMASQSGGLATMAHALAQQAGFGFRYTVSTGNEAVLTAADFVQAFVADPETRVIALYLEGTRDGAGLVAALDAARTAEKPVVVLKGGGTAASARAAAAHTGALAGEARVWSAVLEEHSAIQVASLEELLDVIVFLSSAGGAAFPAGTQTAVVTFGGGSGVLAADQCARAGLSLTPLADETMARLVSLVPETAALGNPVDVTPQTFTRPEWLARFPEALDVIASDAGVDSVLVQCGPMAQGALAVAEAVCDFSLRSPKPVCLAWPLAPSGVPEVLRRRGIHAFGEYARAIGVVAKLAGSRPSAVAGDRRAGPALPAFDWSAFVPEPRAGLVVPEHDCHRLLDAAGLGTAPARLAGSEQEAVDAAEAVGFPVAMKAISPSVTHRAAAGLVNLGVGSAGQARAGYRRLVDRSGALGVPLEGIYVQRMESDGVELLLSAFRDPTFGVIVSCAAGGVLTEAIDDVTLERAPSARASPERCSSGSGPSAPRSVPSWLSTRAVSPSSSRRSPGSRRRRRGGSSSSSWNPVKWSRERTIAVDGLLIVEEP